MAASKAAEKVATELTEAEKMVKKLSLGDRRALIAAEGAHHACLLVPFFICVFACGCRWERAQA